ncbi:hypothetical protein PR048_007659 [Dryococelus australis]|uniref:Uncharacterized protein n=1 Tax=Dryococelus australis TaxID=614101 RepID=A0ABQ9HV96_9NEOP|nr:hypothetical protein PR048_007659 [Dryococelus australis]
MADNLRSVAYRYIPPTLFVYVVRCNRIRLAGHSASNEILLSSPRCVVGRNAKEASVAAADETRVYGVKYPRADNKPAGGGLVLVALSSNDPTSISLGGPFSALRGGKSKNKTDPRLKRFGAALNNEVLSAD